MRIRYKYTAMSNQGRSHSFASETRNLREAFDLATKHAGEMWPHLVGERIRLQVTRAGKEHGRDEGVAGWIKVL
jgi:hypothetical protein